MAFLQCGVAMWMHLIRRVTKTRSDQDEPLAQRYQWGGEFASLDSAQ